MSPAILMLIPALIAVESRGNLRATSPDGKAWGCLQITQGVLDDVNQSQGHIEFTRADCFRKTRAVAIFCQYVKRYSIPEYIGAEPTRRDVALLWRYGPEGMRKGDPEGYWTRVEALAAN